MGDEIVIFDFMISHKSNKSNPTDVLSKHPNYKNEDIFMNKFLFILQ